MNEARLQDVTLRYATSGEGPVALFLHGFPLDHGMWDGQRAGLADVRACVAPDLRGFGASGSLREETLTMEQHARDAVALLDAIGVEQADVVALSMGGYVALSLWELHPERVRSLALVDTRAEADDEAGRAKRDEAIERLLSDGREAFAAGMLGALVGPEAPAAARAAVRDMIEGTSYETIAAALRGMKVRADRTALLESISIPAMVVCGEHDVITPPALSEGMAARIPGARLELVAGSGHMAPLEKPELVNDALRSFWVG